MCSKTQLFLTLYWDFELLGHAISKTVEVQKSCIQLWTFAYIRLLNRPYENEVTSKEHN